HRGTTASPLPVPGLERVARDSWGRTPPRASPIRPASAGARRGPPTTKWADPASFYTAKTEVSRGWAIRPPRKGRRQEHGRHADPLLRLPQIRALTNPLDAIGTGSVIPAAALAPQARPAGNVMVGFDVGYAVPVVVTGALGKGSGKERGECDEDGQGGAYLQHDAVLIAGREDDEMGPDRY